MLEDFLHFDVSSACIAIIATLLGAGYPLFLNLFKDVNVFYKSTLILSELKKDGYFIGFRFWSKISLIALFIWVCGFEPLFNTNSEKINFIINNSSEILLLLSTTVLVINFLLFIRNTFNYYQPYETATKLIKKYKENF